MLKLCIICVQCTTHVLHRHLLLYACAVDYSTTGTVYMGKFILTCVHRLWLDVVVVAVHIMIAPVTQTKRL